MKDRSDKAPRKSEFERRINYDQFLLAVLDDRHKISEELINKTTSLQMQCYGFHIDHYTPPEILDSFITPFSSVTVDMSATRHSDGTSTVDSLDFYPEDDPPFSIKQRDTSAEIKQFADKHPAPADSPMIALRQLMPEQVRHSATPDQMLTYVHTFSPESENLVEYTTQSEDFRGIIRFTNAEAVDDTIDRLEVIKYFNHPSDAEVGTRMLLEESLNARSQEEDPDKAIYELTIEALFKEKSDSDELTVDTILSAGNRITPVKLATRRHIQDIADVLHTLDIPLAAVDFANELKSK
ncbi:MAG TPA: hypothetical protein VFM68_04400 [Candidatus Saccharimonadales bacterium]|nr:hypothetical protein [Candidatus Saccharimonadales bacterium]